MEHPNVVVAAMAAPLPQESTSYTCPSCHERIATRVDYQTGTAAYLIGLALCVFGCWCCVCIPFCSNKCKDANHYCPHCDTYIGAHKMM